MEIEFWEDHQQNSPIKKFILSQKSQKFKKKVKKLLIRISNVNFTNAIQSGFFKKISGIKKIYEIPFSFNKTYYRFLLTVINKKVILLHIFKKKSNKTPQKEILIAKKRRDNLNK